LEDEFWVFRLEDYPNEEDCHQDDDDEADDCSTDSTGGSASSTATTVVSALFGRHWYYVFTALCWDFSFSMIEL